MPSGPTLLPGSIANADTRPYWVGAANGQLMLQRCTACNHMRFLPAHLCPMCWNEGATWFPASGRGTVATFTVVHRPPSPAFAGRVPYVVALIDLEEGPRMMSNILGSDALEVAIGDSVRVTFEACEGGTFLPQFERVLVDGAVADEAGGETP